MNSLASAPRRLASRAPSPRSQGAVRNQIRLDHPDVLDYSVGEVVAHIVATLLACVALITGAAWLWWNVERIEQPYLGLVPAVLAGLLLADWVSGLLHWALDTWFHAETPALGRMVKTVREHHIFPSDVLDYRLRHHVGMLSVPALVLSAPVVLMVVCVSAPGAWMMALATALLVASTGVLFMFETHKVGHRPKGSWATKALGSLHLLVTPAHHMKHHRAPYDFNYCLINGWADWLMSRCDGWRRLERLITRVTKAIPREDDRRWLERYVPVAPDGRDGRGA